MRYTELSEYNDELTKADLSDDAAFQFLLKQSELVLCMSDADLAREFRVSRPTVNRWRSGKNVPYVMARKGIIEFLKRKTRALMKKAADSIGGGLGGNGESSYNLLK